MGKVKDSLINNESWRDLVDGLNDDILDYDFEDAYERHFVNDHLDCELGNKRTSEPVRRHCQVPFWRDDSESLL